MGERGRKRKREKEREREGRGVLCARADHRHLDRSSSFRRVVTSGVPVLFELLLTAVRLTAIVVYGTQKIFSQGNTLFSFFFFFFYDGTFIFSSGTSLFFFSLSLLHFAPRPISLRDNIAQNRLLSLRWIFL